jgi:hypothetical protein
LSKRIHILPLILLSLLSAAAHAQWAEVTTGSLDARTLRIQTKAEALYVSGDFKRAHFIYVNELAGRGDKYAQYMAGFMYLMGQGVPEDPILASAWYRISAERDAPEFMVVRDRLLQSFSPEQRARSDSHYLDLRKKYSDLVIVMKLVEKDQQKLQFETTGSRVPGRSTMVTMVDPKSGTTVSADYYRSRVLRLMQSRVDFITTQLDIDALDAELSGAEVAELWEHINEYVAVVDDEAGAYVATP